MLPPFAPRPLIYTIAVNVVSLTFSQSGLSVPVPCAARFVFTISESIRMLFLARLFVDHVCAAGTRETRLNMTRDKHYRHHMIPVRQQYGLRHEELQHKQTNRLRI
jgi:hypothetical protein